MKEASSESLMPFLVLGDADLKIQSAGGCLRSAIALLGGLAVLIGWSEFMFKPIRYYAKKNEFSLAEALADLMQVHSPAFEWPGAGIVWLIASGLLVYLAIILVMRPVRSALDFLERSEAPVSILEISIELRMLDEKLTLCRTTRKQLFHANTGNVGAYNTNQTTNHGTYDTENLSIESRINGELLTTELIALDGGKTLETIEIFDRSLPTHWSATYVPDNLVRVAFRHLGWFKKHVVERKVVVTDRDEYSVAKPSYKLAAARWPASCIKITLSLPANSICRTESVRAFLVMAQAVSKLPVVRDESEDGRINLLIKRDTLLQHQAILIIWENDLATET